MRERRNTTLSSSPPLSTYSPATESCPRLDTFCEKRYSSPPPSPISTLPSPVLSSREDRRKKPLSHYFIARIIAAVLSLCIVLRCLSRSTGTTPNITRLSETSTPLFDHVPSQPAAIFLPSTADGPRWSISIPHDRSFPLPAATYRGICEQAQALGEKTAQGVLTRQSKWWSKFSHPNAQALMDSTYVDVADAESVSLLPPSENSEINTTNAGNVCAKSLTFVLSAEDVSFGESLLALWLSYGLAQNEGRAFFLDDSHWAWGNFTAYFKPPPAPSCLAPPVHHRVPCPAAARHRIVSRESLSSSLEHVPRQHVAHGGSQFRHTHGRAQALSLLRQGYDALFHPLDEDAEYVAERSKHFREEARRAGSAALVGVHIRRGDRHPFEYQYSHDYLPLVRYVDAAHALLEQLLSKWNRLALGQTVKQVFGKGRAMLTPSSGSASQPTATPGSAQHPSISPTPFLLASDDPEIHLASEMSIATAPHLLTPLRAQEKIVLATKSTLDRAIREQQNQQPQQPSQQQQQPPTPSWSRKHVPENAGWDGGFYSGMFAASLIHHADGSNANDNSAAVQVRTFVGRAYVLDLAVLADAADGVVCAVSSAGCRILGVAKSDAKRGVLTERRWRNVDDGRAWSWDGRA